MYRDTYSQVVHRFLGWTVAKGRHQVDEWLRQEDFRLWFGHTTAVADSAPSIARSVFPAQLLERIAQLGEHANMCRAITEAIEGSGEGYDEHPDRNPSYDWDAARDRVFEVVARYQKEIRVIVRDS